MHTFQINVLIQFLVSSLHNGITVHGTRNVKFANAQQPEQMLEDTKNWLKTLNCKVCIALVYVT